MKHHVTKTHEEDLGLFLHHLTSVKHVHVCITLVVTMKNELVIVAIEQQTSILSSISPSRLGQSQQSYMNYIPSCLETSTSH